jgi:hypothetical protein
MSDPRVYLNGINGRTGEYLVPPVALGDVVALARGFSLDPAQANWLQAIRQALQRPSLGLPVGTDPRDVGQAGWAVVFPSGTSPEVRGAVETLLAHRRSRVPPHIYKELEYHPGETVRGWMTRHNVVPGNTVQTRVPYYVALVGDPTAIPFEFQYLLDLDYAVGRLAFDEPDQYRQYAESVVAYETAEAVPNGREVVYWGPRHYADPATQMSADNLITPLAAGTSEEPSIAAVSTPGYRSRCINAGEATKARLLEVLRAPGSVPPAMLFTASHGVGWPLHDPQQRTAQGALLCQDWSGFGSILPGHYLTAAEIQDDACVHGLVAFVFACYGAGTPALDSFLLDRQQGPVRIAEQPFVAALPQRLLAHPRGSALAVIGHVERAWGYSIQPPGVSPQLQPFRNLIGRVLAGEPVGHATKDFSEKYASLSAALLSLLDETQSSPRPGDLELAWNWIERNDAQNYVVLGDPAVHLRVELFQ